MSRAMCRISSRAVRCGGMFAFIQLSIRILSSVETGRFFTWEHIWQVLAVVRDFGSKTVELTKASWSLATLVTN